MKRLFFVFPVVSLLASGCTSNQQVIEKQSINTQHPQSQQLTPTQKPDSLNTGTAKKTEVYSSNYGYQFSYSNDYFLVTNDPTKIRLRSQSTTPTDSNGNKAPADVTIAYYNDLAKLTYYQRGMKDANDYVAESGSAGSINNATSYKNKDGVLIYSFTDVGLKAVYTELIPHNGHFYELSFFKRETSDQLNASEKQIQQTFKFTK